MLGDRHNFIGFSAKKFNEKLDELASTIFAMSSSVSTKTSLTAQILSFLGSRIQPQLALRALIRLQLRMEKEKQ